MRIPLLTSESITAVLSGAPATTNPTYHAVWQDQSVEQSASGSLSGTTAVTVLSAGNSTRKVLTGLAICNIDTASVVVTVKRVNAAGTAYTLCVTTLAVGDTLILDEYGARVIDTSGAAKNTQASTAVVDHTLDMTQARVWDALQTTLPGTAANDDLAIVSGTFLTSAPVFRTSDAKAATVTQKLRQPYEVPSSYVAGQPITLRINAGMVTTVANGTATIDAEVCRQAAPSTDICATAAQSINSLTAADKDFTITPTNVVPGDVLDIVLTIAITDSGTGTAVLGQINSVKVRATERV